MSDHVSRRGLLAGVAGAAGVASAAGTAAAQEGGNQTENNTSEMGANQSESGGASGGGTKTVEVGPSGSQHKFVPGTEETMYIKPGTTVNFVWKSDGHNIVVDSQPDGANWSGAPKKDAGFESTHTFETKGVYDYVCAPHEGLGMVGKIEVTDTIPQKEGHFQTILPDGAKTMGVATVGGMTSVLGLAYFFLKYGGDYEEPS